MSQERKTRWRKEIEWLLSVTDHIVEFAPSQQLAKDGSTMEVNTQLENYLIDVHRGSGSPMIRDSSHSHNWDNVGVQS